MSGGTMHDDEVATDAALVRRLLAAQFPAWARLAITRVASAGTDNALYRLGDELVARLPRLEAVAAQVLRDHVWLPRLAPHLPLAIPAPVALGAPGAGYPWPWAVHRWLAGADALAAPVSDPDQAARDLAGFITALHAVPATGWPPPEPPTSFRGMPLATRDAAVRGAIAVLAGELDAPAATAAWEAALAAPAWPHPPVWIHADLTPLNLLVERGWLRAVIDFGGLGLGDPAVDLIAVWGYLPAASRAVLREALAVDDATWARGRGWALSLGLLAVPYYHQTNPVLAGVGRRAIAAVLARDEPSG